MADDVIHEKSRAIERFVARAREEYGSDPEGFERDATRRDAAVLNILRACEAVFELGRHVIAREGLAPAPDADDIFDRLAEAGWIEPVLAGRMKHLGQYRNIAIHHLQALLAPLTVSMIRHRLAVFEEFARVLARRDASI